jgi:hypothetical protein
MISVMVSYVSTPLVPALVAAAFFLFPACLPSDPGPRGEVAVSMSGDAIVLRVRPCDANALVKSAALLDATGQAGDEGKVLWEVSADEGSLVREYDVGRIAPGFVELMPLQDFDRGAEHVARITLVSGGLPLLTSFVPSELQENRWRVSGGRSLSEDQLQDLQPCS